MSRGRPTTYSEKMATAICVRIMDGESLRSICLEDGMPARSTVHLWLTEHADFSDRYARAREFQADTLFDEIQDIADDGSNDWMEKFDDEGVSIGWRENGEALQRSKLRVDARKWMAGKLRPKKYGEKTVLSGDPDSPIEVKQTIDPSKLSVEAQREILAAAAQPK